MESLSELVRSKAYDFDVLDEFVEIDKWDERSIGIEVFNPDLLAASRSNNGIFESTCIEGNMGGLILIHIKPGEVCMHTHEYEHVGFVLDGSFSFLYDGGMVTLHKGDVYRILPNVPHRICCLNDATVIQAFS